LAQHFSFGFLGLCRQRRFALMLAAPKIQNQQQLNLQSRE